MVMEVFTFKWTKFSCEGMNINLEFMIVNVREGYLIHFQRLKGLIFISNLCCTNGSKGVNLNLAHLVVKGLTSI